MLLSVKEPVFTANDEALSLLVGIWLDPDPLDDPLREGNSKARMFINEATSAKVYKMYHITRQPIKAIRSI